MKTITLIIALLISAISSVATPISKNNEANRVYRYEAPAIGASCHNGKISFYNTTVGVRVRRPTSPSFTKNPQQPFESIYAYKKIVNKTPEQLKKEREYSLMLEAKNKELVAAKRKELIAKGILTGN